LTAANERTELERLRVAVGEQIGFAFEDERLEQLGHAVAGRIAELGLGGLDAYVARLRSVAHRVDETAALAELLTVTETFFWRHHDQIQAFVETALAERVNRSQRRLRVLSAGCASGEEPYSLVIALREAIPDLDAWDVKILGLDVNRTMLAKAARARYSAWSLRSTPAPLKARYFRAEGHEFTLSESVTRLVEFREHNLATPEPLFFRGLGVDVVFCRNVIMYFTPESMRRVVAELTSALVPGGHLFLGHAETLRGLSHDYHLCHTHGTFYYQRRDADSPHPGVASDGQIPRPYPELAILPEVVDGSVSWFEAIQAASLRVTDLANGAGRAPGAKVEKNGSATGARALGGSELSLVLSLVQRERFEEALALLDGLTPDERGQPDALLLSAVLLTNKGRLAEAERACEKLLAADDLHAGAHYLSALCREHEGDGRGAAEHDRIAVHLDPTFAMPHLHLGLLAKRAGDATAARRDLERALLLLEREDTSRLVLFAGGFSREALVGLCRAELARLGGAR
jgi:chemotaxis protein methyltransferase CheR